MHHTYGNPVLDRQAFEKNQTISIQKAINTVECATKEKHIRTAVLGTYQEKGARMFWQIVQKLPFATQPIVAWKLCHVVHKLIRDGHPTALKDSMNHRSQLVDVARNWKHTPSIYGKLAGTYLKCLTTRMDFHRKHENFSGNLALSVGDIEDLGHDDINASFSLCVDLLDNLDSLIDLERKVFSTLDSSIAYSLTGPGQCRLSPCILVIQDTSQLYDHTVKILFHLHGCLPSDALSGHRKRFEACFNSLKNFYNICSNLQYFKKLIQIPFLSDFPPDFLVKSNNTFELGPVQVLEEEPEPDMDDFVDPNMEHLYGNIDPIFMINDLTSTMFERDEKDDELELLKAEVARLKAHIELLRAEFNQEIHTLLEEIRHLHRDIHESQVVANTASNKGALLKREVEEKVATQNSKVRNQLQAIEKKANDNEEIYRKLKKKHMQLVKDHAELLRKSAETKRVSDSMHLTIETGLNENVELKREIEYLKKQLQAGLFGNEEREKELRKQKEKLLNAATKQASDLIHVATQSLNDVSSNHTCTAESLVYFVTRTYGSLERVDQQISNYKQTQEIDALIQALFYFGHSMAHTIENGGATCNMVEESQGQNLRSSCRNCGNIALSFLNEIRKNGASTSVRNGLDQVQIEAKALLPKMSDIKGGDLNDLVEQEMASTAQAVEQAADRIEALLNEARKKNSGVSLEVNERILDSCTELMKMIKILITTATDLQRDIVATGRGKSTKREFYMKNSRWTEGLISAAKAVGWGATMLTDSADLVIQGTGKFEELMVWSHEISASTAQLVAASRVKSSNLNAKLSRLEHASRNVNGATSKVVAATNAGRQQLDDANKFADIAKIASLTQIKRKEMDSHVKVLELEQSLQQERQKLGTLRKKHYELAELKEFDEKKISSKIDDKTAKPPTLKVLPSNKPVIPIKPVLSVKPAIKQKPHLPPKPQTKPEKSVSQLRK